MSTCVRHNSKTIPNNVQIVRCTLVGNSLRQLTMNNGLIPAISF